MAGASGAGYTLLLIHTWLLWTIVIVGVLVVGAIGYAIGASAHYEPRVNPWTRVDGDWNQCHTCGLFGTSCTCKKVSS